MQDLVRRILSYLFVPALARFYNLTGQKGKESFIRLKIFQVIVGEHFKLLLLES